MSQNLGFRFFVIALVVGFLGWMSYKAVLRKPGLELGIDLRGGSEIEFAFDFDTPGAGYVEPRLRADTLKQALSIIQQRVDAYGLKDVIIQPIGDHKFTVQISAKEKQNVDAIKGLITVLGKLEFRITVEPDAPNYTFYWNRFKKALETGTPPLSMARNVKPEDRAPDDISNGRYAVGLRWYPLSEVGRKQFPRNNPNRPPRRPPGDEPWVLCELDDYNITGDSLANATYRRDTRGLGGGDWIVVFDVEKGYRKNMLKLTEDEGTFMAIILNDELDSAPVLISSLSSSGQISGSFTEKKARALAAVLKAGALNQKPELIAERTVASDLAGSARDTGILSIAIGFVAVLVLMTWLYLGPGLLANIALLLNLVLVVGVLYWFGAVLTLPGLAGLVLTVGMAVDANILVFERIKEEKAKGRTVAQAVMTGYDRALVTIIDSNLTTLITAYMLFQIGSGPVRGFGITLAIGILASMFTALYVTRTIFAALLRRGVITEAKMRGEFMPPQIPWMSMKRRAVPISAFLMILGLVIYDIVPEKKKYDIEFTQGAKLIMRFHKTVPLDTVRDHLDQMAAANPQYKNIKVRVSAAGIGTEVVSTEGNGFELRTQEIGSDAEIRAFLHDLRATFVDVLLPGPFDATLQDAGSGGMTGTIYFQREGILETWILEALRQSGKFAGVGVKALPRVPGAGSVLRITVKSPGAIALNVRNALRSFDAADAKNKLAADATDDTKTATQQAAARAALATLDKLPDPLPDRFFAEMDPFPLHDRIDPSTAREHRDAAVRAIALSIVGIILYVAFRFRSWAFGFAAVVALVHDVLVVMGIVAAVNWLGLVDARLNLVTVAAFLTLIGYSINDSIVVFDRIRENYGTGRSRMSENIDKSLNQTLSRTIRTTSTTWTVVFILFVMNSTANSALGGFAFILTLGVLVGTYSSIFIASPTLLFLPWFWERCGGTAKAYFAKCLPWIVVSGAALLGIDGAKGELFVGDQSRLIFNDILLAFPIGILAMFLFHFVRFVRQDEGGKQATAA